MSDVDSDYTDKDTLADKQPRKESKKKLPIKEKSPSPKKVEHAREKYSKSPKRDKWQKLNQATESTDSVSTSDSEPIRRRAKEYDYDYQGEKCDFEPGTFTFMNQYESKIKNMYSTSLSFMKVHEEKYQLRIRRLKPVYTHQFLKT